MERTLRVDWIRCEGYGLCGDLAPDLIALDDWRYPVILEPVVRGGLLNDAQRAVDCCPRRALSLVTEDHPRPRTGRRLVVDASDRSS
jgi:ferredoxin